MDSEHEGTSSRKIGFDPWNESLGMLFDMRYEDLVIKEREKKLLPSPEKTNEKGWGVLYPGHKPIYTSEESFFQVYDALCKKFGIKNRIAAVISTPEDDEVEEPFSGERRAELMRDILSNMAHDNKLNYAEAVILSSMLGYNEAERKRFVEKVGKPHTDKLLAAERDTTLKESAKALIRKYVARKLDAVDVSPRDVQAEWEKEITKVRPDWREILTLTDRDYKRIEDAQRAHEQKKGKSSKAGTTDGEEDAPEENAVKPPKKPAKKRERSKAEKREPVTRHSDEELEAITLGDEAEEAFKAIEELKLPDRKDTLGNYINFLARGAKGKLYPNMSCFLRALATCVANFREEESLNFENIRESGWPNGYVINKDEALVLAVTFKLRPRDTDKFFDAVMAHNALTLQKEPAEYQRQWRAEEGKINEDTLRNAMPIIWHTAITEKGDMPPLSNVRHQVQAPPAPPPQTPPPKKSPSITPPAGASPVPTQPAAATPTRPPLQTPPSPPAQPPVIQPPVVSPPMHQGSETVEFRSDATDAFNEWLIYMRASSGQPYMSSQSQRNLQENLDVFAQQAIGEGKLYSSLEDFNQTLNICMKRLQHGNYGFPPEALGLVASHENGNSAYKLPAECQLNKLGVIALAAALGMTPEARGEFYEAAMQENVNQLRNAISGVSIDYIRNTWGINNRESFQRLEHEIGKEVAVAWYKMGRQKPPQQPVVTHTTPETTATQAEPAEETQTPPPLPIQSPPVTTAPAETETAAAPKNKGGRPPAASTPDSRSDDERQHAYRAAIIGAKRSYEAMKKYDEKQVQEIATRLLLTLFHASQRADASWKGRALSEMLAGTVSTQICDGLIAKTKPIFLETFAVGAAEGKKAPADIFIDSIGIKDPELDTAARMYLSGIPLAKIEHPADDLLQYARTHQAELSDYLKLLRYSYHMNTDNFLEQHLGGISRTRFDKLKRTGTKSAKGSSRHEGDEISDEGDEASETQHRDREAVKRGGSSDLNMDSLLAALEHLGFQKPESRLHFRQMAIGIPPEYTPEMLNGCFDSIGGKPPLVNENTDAIKGSEERKVARTEALSNFARILRNVRGLRDFKELAREIINASDRAASGLEDDRNKAIAALHRALNNHARRADDTGEIHSTGNALFSQEHAQLIAQFAFPDRDDLRQRCTEFLGNRERYASVDHHKKLIKAWDTRRAKAKSPLDHAARPAVSDDDAPGSLG